ncbi:phage-related protein [Clostridium tetani E88]|uniref:Phage-related protein n=1 Tax=Clostridium tetani (strain Massachusetts / E88) TaxID=212717 RepID=Q894I4_CLOTE|nr:phage-related protein [Clostridium tetani E88]
MYYSCALHFLIAKAICLNAALYCFSSTFLSNFSNNSCNSSVFLYTKAHISCPFLFIFSILSSKTPCVYKYATFPLFTILISLSIFLSSNFSNNFLFNLLLYLSNSSSNLFSLISNSILSILHSSCYTFFHLFPLAILLMCVSLTLYCLANSFCVTPFLRYFLISITSSFLNLQLPFFSPFCAAFIFVVSLTFVPCFPPNFCLLIRFQPFTLCTCFIHQSSLSVNISSVHSSNIVYLILLQSLL